MFNWYDRIYFYLSTNGYFQEQQTRQKLRYLLNEASCSEQFKVIRKDRLTSDKPRKIVPDNKKKISLQQSKTSPGCKTGGGDSSAKSISSKSKHIVMPTTQSLK